jgi:hypothetical protein
MRSRGFGVVAGLAMLAAIAGFTPSHAQKIYPGYSPITSELLDKMQGRWVAVGEDNNTEIEVRGSQVIFTRVDPSRPSPYTPVPGEHFFTIQSSTLNTMIQSRVPGIAPRESRSLGGRCLTRNEAVWRGSPDHGCFGHFVPRGHQHPDYKWVEYWELKIADPSQTGAYIRPEVKDFLLRRGPKPDSVDAVGSTAASPSAQAPARATVRYAPLGRTANDAGAADSSRAVVAAQPAPPPGPSAQDLAEIAEQERLNREQADFAARQLAENNAAKAAFDKATAEHQATIARQQAEAQRNEADYAAAMAKWRADVEACNRGDFSRCAPQQ